MKLNEALQEIAMVCTYPSCDKNCEVLCEAIKVIERELKRLAKVEELLDLYRLQQEFKERYNTEVRILDKQETLDAIREIAEEIYEKEKELEELK